jgi:phosphatidylserine/phosphatidylglycerophosphate/cardiolipin synthase-like enzyme
VVDAAGATGADVTPAGLLERLRPLPLDGNDVVLLESGAQFFPSLVAAIESAHREVWLETYIFAADETGRRVAGALARARGPRAAPRGRDAHA